MKGFFSIEAFLIIFTFLFVVAVIISYIDNEKNIFGDFLIKINLLRYEILKSYEILISSYYSDIYSNTNEIIKLKNPYTNESYIFNLIIDNNKIYSTHNIQAANFWIGNISNGTIKFKKYIKNDGVVDNLPTCDKDVLNNILLKSKVVCYALNITNDFNDIDPLCKLNNVKCPISCFENCFYLCDKYGLTIKNINYTILKEFNTSNTSITIYNNQYNGILCEIQFNLSKISHVGPYLNFKSNKYITVEINNIPVTCAGNGDFSESSIDIKPYLKLGKNTVKILFVDLDKKYVNGAFKFSCYPTLYSVHKEKGLLFDDNFKIVGEIN